MDFNKLKRTFQEHIGDAVDVTKSRLEELRRVGERPDPADIERLIDACTVTRSEHDNDPNCVRVHKPSLVAAIRAAYEHEEK